jgi:hypothetical protein
VAAVKRPERRDELGVRGHTSQVDLVHKGEKFVGVDVVNPHQPIKRRSMFAEIAAPQLRGLFGRHLQKIANVFVHAHLHLVEQAA